MNPALEGIWEHMQDLGLGALAHANRHAAYAAVDNANWHELSVLQAAHAAELLIKARIAQEHPLLVFEHFPSHNRNSDKLLDLEDLFRQGRTLQWSDLPDRLWVTTGIVLPERSCFERFGKLRNTIQHFAVPPDLDASTETLRFIFEVVDPFINSCWNLFAVDYDEDDDPFVYFVGSLIHREIRFLVSPAAAGRFEEWSVDWSKVNASYRKEIRTRVRAALAKLAK